MKICPNCSFSNPEDLPTCAFCNALLVDVPITLSDDPTDPEHTRREQRARRHLLTNRKIRAAAITYAAVVLITAFCTQSITGVATFLLYPGSALFVAFAIHKNWVGAFTAPLMQAGLILTFILVFGPGTLSNFLMLGAGIALSSILCVWMDLIYSYSQ